MDFHWNPQTKVRLNLNGKSVELEGKELFRSLFQQGFLEPDFLSGSLPTNFDSGAFSLRILTSTEIQHGTKVDPSVAWFLNPAFLDAACELENSLSLALKRALHNAWLDGKPAEKAALLSHLGRILEKWGGENALRDKKRQAQSRSETVSGLQMILSAGDNTEIFPISPSDIPKIHALLSGESDTAPSRVAAHIASFLRKLPTQAEKNPPRIWPRPQAGELSALHLGHAGLLLRSRNFSVLVDPVLPAKNTKFEIDPPSLSELGKIDALLLTHHHTDHCDEATLLRFPSDLPIYIPQDVDHDFAPRLKKYLELLGFTKVIPLAHGQSVSFGDELELTALPFYGEASDLLRFGANCYWAHGGNGRNILLHADASPDRHGNSLVSEAGKKWLETMVARYGKAALVFGTWWQQKEFRGLASPLAPFLVEPAQWLDSQEFCCCPKEFLADLAGSVGASHFVLYAEGGSECYLPLEGVSDFIPSFTFGWEQIPAIRAHLRGMPLSEAQPLTEYLVKENGSVALNPTHTAPSRKDLALLS
ncbi:MAG TPA: MBL fold metallo-hydrolase [Bdellovibrionota bacterium]